uniref:Uncharacterized protein n=1 Tax=Anguilla anguilla TaxID=7936 RepID=A0A0E9UWC8_ANGAN
MVNCHSLSLSILLLDP